MSAKDPERKNVTLLTKKQFDVIAELVRAQDPPKTAVAMVLVKGKANHYVVKKTGVSAQSLSNSIGRFRRAHQLILKAYQEKDE